MKRGIYTEMNIEFHSDNGRLFAELSGELDHHSAMEEKPRIEMKLSTNEEHEIIFDLSGLTFMDSSGISLIFGAYKIASEFGQKITVITENERFEKILTMAGMGEFVNIVTKRGELL